VALAILAGACTDDDDATPTPTTQDTSSTTLVDRSGISLAGVPGSTTTTVVERGTATLTGSVQGPAGVVVGATVRIERLVGAREVRTDLLTGPDGRFTLAGMPGGRYRVRAFLAPTLAQLEPDVQFLPDGTQHDFQLVMSAQGGVVVRADVAPEPPLLGHAVNLVAAVSMTSVDADGVVRFNPVVGASVELGGLGRWVLRDDTASTATTFGSSTTTYRPPPSPTASTDSSGRVRYELQCNDLGDSGLYLRVPVRSAAPPVTDPTGATPPTFPAPTVSVQAFDLEIPACVDPSALTTTTTAPLATTETTTG
jgi:hypothetical protein